jgi:hypothetical protein
MKAVMHNRLVRLHRPFYLAGWTNSTYAHSTITCVRSATAIALALEVCAGTSFIRYWA